MKHQKSVNDGIRKLRTLALCLVVPFLFGVVSLGGCLEESTPDEPSDGTVQRSFQLNRFANCDDLDDYLTDVIADMATQAIVYGYYGYGGMLGGGSRGESAAWDADDTPAPQAGNEGGDTSTGSASPTDFTGTNTQEENVDEADLTKTDGDYIYAIENNVLHIVRSWPANETELLSTFELSGWGDSMFLAGDRVVVFTSINEYASDYCDSAYAPCSGDYDTGVPNQTEPSNPPERDSESTDGSEGSEGSEEGDDDPDGEPDYPDDDPIVDTDMPTESFYGTRITVIDVTDRTAPALLAEYDIEGSYVSARMVGDDIYMVVMGTIYSYDYELMSALEALDLPEIDWEMTYEERVALEPTVLNMVTPIVADWVATKGRAAIIPDIRVNGEDRADGFTCGEIYHPGQETDLGMLTLTAIDSQGDDGPTGVGLLANGWVTYGSESAIYVAQDSRWWWWSNNEDRYTETHVHQFALNDGNPAYQASGAVPGWVLNQFSMSEHDGHLRIATTDQTLDGWWWGDTTDDAVSSTGTSTTTPDDVPSTGSSDDEEPPVTDPEPEPVTEPDPEPEIPAEDANNVFVLAQSGGLLEIVGEVRGIAPGEQIYAVRFLGNRGFVVTFEQIDPLFTLDLSDPTNPQLLGELEITGFSTYLHPFGEDYLIGIGREGDENGWITDLQLQLFDVSDMSNPTRIQQEVLGMGESGWSSSAAEHDHRAFTFWVTENLLAIPVTLEDWSYETDEYRYFSGIIVYEVSAEDGFVEIGRVSHTDFATDVYCGSDSTCAASEYYWYSWMQRSTFIDGYLYAISNLGLSVSSVENLEETLAEVAWTNSYSYYGGGRYYYE